MGRKIPAKKHRGVKDPLEQQARRLQSLQSKINAPPAAPDEQPVPRSLERLFAFQHRRPRAGKPRADRRVHKAQATERDKRGVGDNPVSRLRKLPGESGRGFSLRINGAVRALRGLPGSEQADALDIEEEEDECGARMAELRERRARKRRRAAAGARAGRVSPPATLTRTQKLALKKKARMEKADEEAHERRSAAPERVPFGDVAHAPPALRGVAPAARPGRRDLLLTALLRGAGAAGAGAGAAAEARRLDAVAAYRALKAANRRGRKPA